MGAFSNAPTGANSRGAGTTAFGGGKGSSFKTRVDWGKAADDYSVAYGKQQNAQQVIDVLSGHNTSLKPADAMALAKKAHSDGLFSDDDYNKALKGLWQVDQQQIQKQSQDTMNKNTIPVERFAAGIGGMVHDIATGTPGSITAGVKNGIAGVAHQANTGSAQLDQTMTQQLQREQGKYLQGLVSQGKLTQDQANQHMAKINAAASAASKQAQADLKISQADDPAKVAAGLAELPLYMTGLGEAAPLLKGGETLAQFGGRILGEGVIGGAVGGTDTVANEGKDVKLQDVAANTAFGAATGAAVPIAGKFLRPGASVDKATGAAIAAVGSKLADPATHPDIAAALHAIKDRGLVGAADTAVSNAGKKASYAVQDLLNTTAAGRAVTGFGDKLNSAFVTNLHPVYKEANRMDFENKVNPQAPQSATFKISNATNDAYHFKEAAIQHIQEDPGQQARNAAIVSQGGDVMHAAKNQDIYDAARQDYELMKSGKKEYTGDTAQAVQERWDHAQSLPHQEALGTGYKGLVDSYKNRLELDHANGLVRDDVYEKLKNDPHEYIRLQREQPDWKVEKAEKQGRRSSGTNFSVGDTGLGQKRSKYASGRILSPQATYIQAIEHSYKTHLENQAAKTIYDVLKDSPRDIAHMMTGTEQRLQYEALLHAAHDKNPQITSLNRSLRTNRNQAKELAKQITALNARGRVRVSQELNNALKIIKDAGLADPNHPMNPREVMQILATLDHKDFRAIRKMVESRNIKLGNVLDTIENVNRQLQDAYAEKHGLISDARGLGVHPDTKNVEHFEFFDKGIKNIIRVDPSIGAALKGYNKEMSNVILKYAQVPTYIFKLGTTTGNLAFAAVNLPKDLLESLINSQRSFSTHMNPANHMAVLLAMAGKPLNADEAEMMRQWARGFKGGRNIDIYARPKSAQREASDLLMENVKFSQKAFTYIHNPSQGGHAALTMANELIGKSEDYTRYLNWRGTYTKAIKEGYHTTDAIAMANKASRENSINFLEHGDVGQVFNAFIPYFNATIQSNRQLFRKFRDNPVSAVTKLGTFIGVPMAAATYWNTSDPKRAAVYKEIPEYVKQANFLIVGNDAKWDATAKKWRGVVLIPKPIGYGALADPIRQFIEWQADNKPEDHANVAKFLQDDAGNLVETANNAFSPVDFSSSRAFWNSVLPQIFKPSIEGVTNMDFYTGQKIVPDSMKDLPAGDQHYANTSQLSTYIGSVFGWSPLKVDHWIKGTFGEVGTNAQHYIDQYALGGQDKVTNPDTGKTGSTIGGRSIPESIVRRFAGVPGQEDQTQFYNTYNPVYSKQQRVDAQVTALVGQGKRAQAERVATDFNNSVGGYFQKWKQEYGNSPTYDKSWDDKISGLQIKTGDRAFNQRYKDYQKKQQSQN